MLQKNLCTSDSPLSAQPDAPVNPNWLAFFRRVRELAEFARQREAQAQASAALDPSGSQAATTIDKEKAPAVTGAYAKSQDCFSTTPKDCDYYERTR